MNARELEQWFGDWRQLTEAESRAIACDDWTEVQRQQQQKQGLQVRLLRAQEVWQTLWPGTRETRIDCERRFRPIIAELIALETANAKIVAVRHESAQHESTECDRAAENLRGLNRAYGASDGGHWSSYS